MTTEYQAVAIFGASFPSYEEAEKFLADNGVEANDEISGAELGIECLNAFTGGNCFVGFELELGKKFDWYQARWNALFPNSDIVPTGHLEVKVY